MTVLGKLSHRRSRFGRRACLRDTLRKIESNTQKLSMENTSSQSRFPRWDGLNLEDYADTPNPWSEAEEDAYYEPLEAWDASRPIILPEPGEFRPHEETEYKRVDLRKKFPGQRIQVIVKLANIELTPESPDYEGGSCHIEGQLVGAINLFFPSSGLILSPPRTNASQHRRFTTTIAKILSRVHSLSANMEGATFGCSVPVKA